MQLLTKFVVNIDPTILNVGLKLQYCLFQLSKHFSTHSIKLTQ